jgi:hypothetical protein
MSLLVTGLQGRHHDASPPTRAKKNGANIFGWDVLECHWNKNFMIGSKIFQDFFLILRG